MKDVQDAIGHLIADHLNGEAAEKIVERDDGYIGKSGGPAAYSADFEDWPIIDQRSMYYVKGRVLDIGCGAGRHALYLQGKGLDVLGIDVSPLAIHACKKRGVTDARVMSITKVSARLGEFDSVLSNDGSQLRAVRQLRESQAFAQAVSQHDKPRCQDCGYDTGPI